MRAMSAIDDRLHELGLELPPPPAPVASYVPYLRAGDLVFIAGQIPMIDGELLYPGTVGDDVDIEQAQEAAGRCAMQALAALNAELHGELDERLVGIDKLEVMIAAAPGFTEHPIGANGASDLLVKILGDRGKHTRVAIGVSSLPLGSCIEIVMTAQVV